jgi:type IV pilus assembly protein PilX
MNTMNQNSYSQSGMVLLVGLVFLTILTIIGITAMNATSITEKMTQNLRDSTTAFEAAESALSDGEAWVQDQSQIPAVVTSCGTPPCTVWQKDAAGTLYQQPASWWQSQALNFSGTITEVAVQPQYVLEQYSFVPYELSPDSRSKGQGYYYYRVTSRGTGKTVNTIVNLQSVYVTQFN